MTQKSPVKRKNLDKRRQDLINPDEAKFQDIN
jgi:hypothetical protein